MTLQHIRETVGRQKDKGMSYAFLQGTRSVRVIGWDVTNRVRPQPLVQIS